MHYELGAPLLRRVGLSTASHSAAKERQQNGLSPSVPAWAGVSIPRAGVFLRYCRCVPPDLKL